MNTPLYIRSGISILALYCVWLFSEDPSLPPNQSQWGRLNTMSTNKSPDTSGRVQLDTYNLLVGKLYIQIFGHDLCIHRFTNSRKENDIVSEKLISSHCTEVSILPIWIVLLPWSGFPVQDDQYQLHYPPTCLPLQQHHQMFLSLIHIWRCRRRG